VSESDPDRDDAAKVYRFLRDAGPSTVLDLADLLLPVRDEEMPATTRRALQRVALRRAFDAVTYIRAHGQIVRCLPRTEIDLDDALSTFELGGPVEVVSPLRPR